MEKLQGQQREDDDQSFDAFTAVMRKEHSGSLRLYGRGFTKTTLKRKALFEPCSTSNDERMKKMEELEERRHQRMLEKLEQQKEAIHQEVTNDILGRLKHVYPGLQLNVVTLASLGAQSPQEDMQPLHHQSSSKNNQGGEDNREEEDESNSDEGLT